MSIRKKIPVRIVNDQAQAMQMRDVLDGLHNLASMTRLAAALQWDDVNIGEPGRPAQATCGQGKARPAPCGEFGNIVELKRRSAASN
jgi:hypothetical protein